MFFSSRSSAHSFWQSLGNVTTFWIVALLLVCFHFELAELEAASPAQLQDCAPSISIGTTMACAISVAAEVDTIQFEAQANDIFLIRAANTAGSLRLRVRVLTSGNVVLYDQRASSGASGVEISKAVISAAGTYKLEINDYPNTATGSYNVYLERLNQPVQSKQLTFGTTIPSTLNIRGQAEVFRISGTKNDRLLIRVVSTAGNLYPRVRLINSSGEVLCYYAVSSSKNAEISDCTLPIDSVYSIVVADYTAAGTGNYNIYAQRFNALVETTALNLNTVQTETLQAPAESDFYTFQGKANEAYQIRLAATANNFYPYIRLIHPNGTVLCVDGRSYSTTSVIARCVLPSDGVYAIQVTSYNESTGVYSLYAQRLNAPQGAIPLQVGLTQTAVISEAAALYSFSIQAAANDVMLFRVVRSSGTLTPSFIIVDADGVVICSASNVLYTYLEVTRCAFPRSGTFWFLIGDHSVNRTGIFEIYAQLLTAPVGASLLNELQPVDATIADYAYLDSYLWEAGAQDELKIEVSVSSGSATPRISVFDLNGTLICSGSSSIAKTVTISRCLLPGSGLYRILVGDATNQFSMIYQLRMSCVSMACGSSEGRIELGPEEQTINLANLQITIPAGALPTGAIWRGVVLEGSPASGIIQSFHMTIHDGAGQQILPSKPLSYSLSFDPTELEGQGIDLDEIGLATWKERAWHPLTVTQTTSSLLSVTDLFGQLAFLGKQVPISEPNRPEEPNQPEQPEEPNQPGEPNQPNSFRILLPFVER